MSGSSDSNQREIRLAVSVIQRWFLTLFHDLCLGRQPDVEIRKPAHLKAINAPGAGEAIPDDWRVRIYLQMNGTEVEYIRTLAHELRHLWQVQNHIPQTERDCENYEEDVLQRFRKGPEAGPYNGPIIGLSRVYRCSRCGERLDDDKNDLSAEEEWMAIQYNRGRLEHDRICLRCIGRDADCQEPLHSPSTRSDKEKACKGAEGGKERAAAERAAEKRRASAERKSAAEARSWQKEIDWWRQRIDNHPDNGKDGYWLVEGQFYVRARTAGEALIKLSGIVALENCRRPKLKFVGDDIASGSTPLL